MEHKKWTAVVGVVLFFGFSLVVSAGKAPQRQSAQAAEANMKNLNSPPMRILFVDENGDGVCDYFRDFDNDGIPNCQDPDWNRPQDGTGNQFRRGNRGGADSFRQRNGFGGGNGMSNQAFRHQQGPMGNGVCSRTGSQGNGYRGGKR